MTELALFLMLAGFLLVTGVLWWRQTQISDRLEILEEDIDEIYNPRARQ